MEKTDNYLEQFLSTFHSNESDELELRIWGQGMTRLICISVSCAARMGGLLVKIS